MGVLSLPPHPRSSAPSCGSTGLRWVAAGSTARSLFPHWVLGRYPCVLGLRDTSGVAHLFLRRVRGTQQPTLNPHQRAPPRLGPGLGLFISVPHTRLSPGDTEGYESRALGDKCMHFTLLRNISASSNLTLLDCLLAFTEKEPGVNNKKHHKRREH